MMAEPSGQIAPESSHHFILTVGLNFQHMLLGEHRKTTANSHCELLLNVDFVLGIIQGVRCSSLQPPQEFGTTLVSH